MQPIIAIIGRPNVGKSTLFNRLIGKKLSITSPVAGTTRDRVYHEAEVDGYGVILADTGGMEFEKKSDIEADVQTQARIAAQEADLVYFVVDGSAPLTSTDIDVAQYLRASGKAIMLIAHKADKKISAEIFPELYRLGLGEPAAVSSIHNIGISELEEQTRLVLKKLGFKKEQPRKTSAVKIAFVGKPNVGKSSLINSLLGKDRLIVSEKPGTTIDATDTPFKAANRSFILIDTAGIRKRGKVGLGIERYGHLRALRAIARCDVACLIVDFERGVTHQDLHVGQYILDAGKGLMILVNKSDLMEDPHKEQQNFLNELHYRLAFIPWAPVLFASAATKKNLFKIFETAQNIQNERMKSIADGEFGTFIKATVLMHPPKRSGKRVIIKNGKQTDTCPPTFTFSSNEPDLVHFSYRRFLENEIRRKYGFFGTVIILNFV